MKHVFILNPCAGNGEGIEVLKKEAREKSLDVELYLTKSAGDATEYVRECCKRENGELRFYACGGDGTIKEVAEGILGFENASMSAYPVGSGNDFVKFFGGVEPFMDIEAIMNAPTVKADILRVTTDKGEVAHSINVCNFGFDSHVGSTMNKVRRKAIIGGSNSYTTGIICGLLFGMRNKGQVFADGELLNPKGKFLLCTAANAGYVGGGINCAPRADITDGCIEVCLIKTISIFTFLKLLGVYKAGAHLDDKRFADKIVYRRVKTLEFIPAKPTSMCLDGEMIDAAKITVDVLSGAIPFAVPKKADVEKADKQAAESCIA